MSNAERHEVQSRIDTRRSQTLTTIVRDAIEQRIVSGELNAGDRINESTLAHELGVSRGPIREACRGLEQAGLVRNVANQGTFVRQVSLDEARNLYEVRGALSALAGRLFVERAPDSTIENLAELIDEMDVAANADDVGLYYQLNIAFHNALVEGAGNPALTELYETIIKKLHLFRRRGLVQKGNLRVSNAEHRIILKAFRERDAAAGAEAVRSHVAGGWSRVSASI